MSIRQVFGSGGEFSGFEATARAMEIDDRRMFSAVHWLVSREGDVTADPNHRLYYEQESRRIAGEMATGPEQADQIIRDYEERMRTLLGGVSSGEA